MTHKMTRIDAVLWARMQALDQKGLVAALGSWLPDGDIESLLRRRDKMKAIVDKLNGKTPERRIDTGVKLLTKDNLETPEMQDLVK
jgi:hypothetical protein